MIVTRTPLRVSFFGGGTDLPEYFESKPGKVLSAAINVYMHIVINETPNRNVKACYDEVELVSTASDIKHNRIREALLEYKVYNNIEISSFCHIPTKGTGLGSSSTYTVGLCSALSKRMNQVIEPGFIAETAYKIERYRCGESLGKQDQYAAAYGGLNVFTFDGDHTTVEPITPDYRTLLKLEDNLMFFYTGVRRDANDILKKQASNTKTGNNTSYLDELALCADVGTEHLLDGNLDEFGKLLNHGWTLKKQMQSDISNQSIDEWYSQAINAGALGGKLLGAGGGGYLMFYVPKHKQDDVRQSLNLKEYKFKFSRTGTEVVYEHRTAYN